MEKLAVSKRNYGDYSSNNYGSHCQEVSIGGLTIYFSYETPIAFNYKGKKVIRKNAWGTTTGKHLNWICPDKKARVSGEVFEKEFNKALEEMGIAI